MVMNIKKIKIGIIGLGYVGLPLAVEFAKKYDSVGYDINIQRITALQNGNDQTREVDTTELTQSTLAYTNLKFPSF